MRTRDLGIAIGMGRPGPLECHHRCAPGCGSGTRRSIAGDGPLVVGRGPIRTGVTVVVPQTRERWTRAGLRGLPPAERQRRDDRPRMGPRVRAPDDAGRDHQHAQRGRRARRPRRGVRRGCGRPGRRSWSLPVVGETYDGGLNDINGFHVRPEHLAGGPVLGRRAGRSPRATSVAGRAWSATSSRAGSGPRLASSRRTAAVIRSASSSRPTTASARGSGSTACRSARRSGSTSCRAPGTRTRRPASGLPPAGVGLDHRRRRDRRTPAAPPVRAPRPARRARHRPGRRHRRSHERRPVHRVRDGQRPPGRRRGRAVRPAPSSVRTVGPAVDRRPVRRRHRGHRGGHRQRARRRRDDDRARRRDRPRPAPRPAARGDGALRARVRDRSQS